MLILYSKYKNKILILNLILSIFFIQSIDASIYTNNFSKDNYILKPGVIAYKVGADNNSGIGGADIEVKDGVLKPSYSLEFVGEDEKSISDIKNKDKISYYIVQAGDNVSKIAKKFGVSKETIIWENNLNSRGFLKLHQKLRILPVSGVSYKVKKNDSLFKIAKKFGVKVEKIEEFNQLAGSLTVGDTLIIPGGKKVVSEKTKITKEKKQKKNNKNNKTQKKITKKELKGIKAYFSRPTNGRFTSPFGWRWGRHHDGVDFGAARGSAVIAAAPGEVVRVVSGCRVGVMSCGGGYGNYVDILHPNGYKTRYAHLIKVNVYKGQKVVRGQLIGGMGNTGHVKPRPYSYKSTRGTHLHFEIIKPNGAKMNSNFMRYK